MMVMVMVMVMVMMMMTVGSLASTTAMAAKTSL